MPGTNVARILLLPERRRFAGQALAPGIAARLGRADRLADALPGEQAQLERYFSVQPAGWPMAAIQRQYDAGDAGDSVWLRADPVFCRPDMIGVRLMAWGNLALDDEESRRFLAAMQPVFGDPGLEVSATAPDRWFVRMPRDTALPIFSDPTQALGTDLFEHIPQGAQGRRWRTLLSETQVVLHNHPGNAARAALGKPPVNSLWFWGGGALPDAIGASIASVVSPDPELSALMALASRTPSGPTLLDLRHERDWAVVERHLPTDSVLALDFADGARWQLSPGQRWRVWQRPLRGLQG